MGYPQI